MAASRVAGGANGARILEIVNVVALSGAMATGGAAKKLAMTLSAVVALAVVTGGAYGLGRALRDAGDAANAAAAAPEAPREDPTGCLALSEAMTACDPGSCHQPHPFVEDFQIEHRILGLEDGACVYAQSRPGNVEVQCRLTQSGRRAQAGILDEIGRGVVSAAYFATECAIRRGGQ